MREEKMQILKMIEEGKISADEGVELLNAVEEREEKILNEEGAKWLRVRVEDKDEKQKVNVNIPISLIDIGLKIGSKYDKDLEGLEGINLAEVIKAVKDGAEGKLVEVEEENGDKVQVFVE